jgi:hypothetical protein
MVKTGIERAGSSPGENASLNKFRLVAGKTSPATVYIG